MTGTASRPKRPGWDAKITGLGARTETRYQVQSLRTWHVSGIDGDDAGAHGEHEPRHAPKRGQALMRDHNGPGLDWDSPCLAFSLPKQGKTEKKGEEDEKR